MSWGWVAVIAALVATFATFMNDRARSKEQLVHKNDIISELKNLITGGDSFLFLRPVQVADQSETDLLLEFRGKYPLYDVSVTLEDFDLVPVAGLANTYAYKKTGQRTVTLGTVNPLRGKLFEQIKIPNTGSNGQFGRRLFLSINTRNSLIEEDIYLRKEGSLYTQAYKVVTFDPNYSDDNQFSIGIKKIRGRIRHIDAGFPVHQLDHLNGDSGWTAHFDEETGVGVQVPAATNSTKKGQ